MALLVRSEAAGCESSFALTSAVPKAAAATGGAGCVVVGWGRAEGSFASVVPDESELDEGGDEEKDTENC
jgi:hypothetical protein